MKATCPACGCGFDLEAAVSDADARRFVDLIAGLDPRVAKPLIQYLALFRPVKTGMRWSRMLALATELQPMIRDARVTRNGTTYVVPTDAWAAALQLLADRPSNVNLPLKSHGYLLEILANKAEKVAAKQESETEQQKTRPRDHSSTGPKAVGQIVDSAALEKNLAALRSAAEPGKK